MARKKGGRGGPRHVRLYHYVLESNAWAALDGNARAIYVEISQRYMGSNNGRIPYAVRDAARSLRISTATASRALRRLEELGFIAIVVKGAFSFKRRHATEWRLTEFCCDIQGEKFGLATKEFMRHGAAPRFSRSHLVN
jgi:DNA-binding transcriptional regulator YhcF (GntR family)